MQLSHLRNYIDRKRNGHQDTIHHTWSHIQQNNYRHIPALKANDINCAEITFRTACATEAIKLATEKYPDMNIGAGTVINSKQCEEAIAAGAKFIVSPGLNPKVVKYCVVVRLLRHLM